MLTGFREAGVVMDYNLLFSVQNLSFLLEGAVVLRSEHASESSWREGGGGLSELVGPWVGSADLGS